MLGTGPLYFFYIFLFFTDTTLLAGYISKENVSKSI